MRITLNLASRPFADLGPAKKRLRIAMGVLAVVAICLGQGLRALHDKAEEARARAYSLDGKIAQITQEQKGYQALMRKPANAKLLAQVETLNQLFDEKAFSWTLAMENLETVLPGGVQVSTLEPIRAKDGHITLHLRVVGPRDKAVELVSNLEHSKRFLLPRIVGESSAETGEGPNAHLEPVSASNRFNLDLLADYNPPAAEEHHPAKASAEATGKKTPEVTKAPAGGDSERAPGHSHAIPQAGRPHGPRPYTVLPKSAPLPHKPNPAVNAAPGGPR